MKNLLLIFTGILLCTGLQAQTALLDVDVAADTVPDRFGPNLPHYVHWYTGIGFLMGPGTGDSLEVLPGFSYQAMIGFRYKRKITSWYSLGIDASYTNIRYRFEQDSSKNFPNRNLHEREVLVNNNLMGELFQRINYTKRGNIIGNYVDMGVYANYGFAFRHRYVDKPEQPTADGAEVVRVVNRRLNYVNPLNYGVRGRIGFSYWSIFGQYRLSNLLKENRGFGELPRLTIGIEVIGASD